MILRNNTLFTFCLNVFIICACIDGVSSQQKPVITAQAQDIAASLDEFMLIPPMPFVTMGTPLVFEGVDYDLLEKLSPKAYNSYYDCHYWFTKCIRDMTNFHLVCVYHYSSSWVNFSNSCQVDLENCKHRVAILWWKKSQGIYGEFGRDPYDYRYIRWYSGDGWDCKYNFRRNVPDDQVNFYYENEEQRIEEEPIME